MDYLSYYDSPVGKLMIRADEQALFSLTIVKDITYETRENELTKLAADELREYFEGKRTRFDLPIAPRGTEFQKKIWAELVRVPFGHTVGYRELGERAYNKQLPRAVGNAVGRNPLLIIIPCHRVIRADGSLGGFSAGIDVKKELMRLEGIEIKQPSKQ